ncbi:hypothetical protein [Halochromatium sp.]
MNINMTLRTILPVLMLGVPMTAMAVDGSHAQDNKGDDEARLPALTGMVRCTVDHVLGCTWERSDCTDGDAVLADVSGDSPTFYELDLLNRVARLKGRDEKGVVVRIDRIGFMPDSDVVNIQGVNEGWMPWTLSYKASNGKGFVSETAPEFSSLYLVNCAVVNKP